MAEAKKETKLDVVIVEAADKLEGQTSHKGNGTLVFAPEAVEAAFKDQGVEMADVLKVQKATKHFVQAATLAASNAGKKVMEADKDIQRTTLVHKVGADKAEFTLDREKTLTIRNPANPDEPARQETRAFYQTTRYASGAGKSNAGLNAVKAHFRAQFEK